MCPLFNPTKGKSGLKGDLLKTQEVQGEEIRSHVVNLNKLSHIDEVHAVFRKEHNVSPLFVSILEYFVTKAGRYPCLNS